MSLVVWGAAALWGLKSGLMKTLIPFSFALFGLVVADSLGGLLGSSLPAIFGGGNGQALAGFFLVYAAMLVVGGALACTLRWVMSLLSTVTWALPLGIVANRGGGLLLGALTGCILLSSILFGFQRYPVAWVSDAVGESSLASAPVGWVDFYVTTASFPED